MSDDAAERVLPWLIVVFVVGSVLALAGLGVVLASGDAAAQEQASALDRITGGEVGTLDRIEAANAAIAAMLNRIGYEIDSATAGVPVVGGDEPADAEQLATNLTETANQNNVTLQAYLNERTNASESMDVLRVDLSQDGETATRYLVADVNNSSDSYENLKMVNSTDRETDGTLALEGYAAANAPAELETFVENYAEPNQDIDAALTRRLAQQYAGDVSLPDGGAS